MRSFLLRIRHSSTMILVVCTILLLVIALLAVVFSYYSINRNIQQQAKGDTKILMATLNSALNEADDVINATKKLINDPCPTVQHKLLNLVESSNWILSVTITHNKKLVCSSYFSEQHNPNMDMNYYIGNNLKLVYTQFLNPIRPILGHNINNGNWDILTNVKIKNIFQIIAKSPFFDNIYIVVGDDWLNSKGQIFINKKLDISNWMSFKSDKYPFSIVVNYAAIKKTDTLIFLSILITITLLIIGLIIALYIISTKPHRDFRRGIAYNEFVPYYQLIKTSDAYTWKGVEVLARWLHPKKGLLQPVSFIELAEQSKMIIPMTKQLMDKVAIDLMPYVDSLPNGFYIGFNIHPSHLISIEFLDDCKNFLAKFPKNKIKLMLELSEREFIDKSELTELLKEIHDSGITIALDDFGTGYSNLAYLQLYTIDHLKIDKMFVSQICPMKDKPLLIDNIINLAKSMKMAIIAEGVENHDQLSYLKKMGVDYIQGFLFSRPLPINETITKLSTYNRSLILSSTLQIG